MPSSRGEGRRPRLLILSQTLPFPPDGGVKIRAWHTWRELANGFDLTALCFYRRSTTLPASAKAGLADIATIHAFPIPQETDPGRLLWDHFRSLATGRVYTRYVYDSAAYRTKLLSLLAEGDWAAVQAESLDLACYFPLVRDVPLICVHHDVQSQLLSRRATVEGSWLRRRYLGHQAVLMRREEVSWAANIALNVVVSETDRQQLLGMAPSARVLIAPNAVDTVQWSPSASSGDEPDDVVFVGGSDWFPNLDGMKWFAESVLPLLRRSRNGIRVRWVGRTSAMEQARFAALGIESTGHVEDPRCYIAQSKCVIVPIRVGGGTRIKLLEAWAAGKAVVSTTIGAEGLAATDDGNILIADTPEQFAAAVSRLLDAPALRNKLGHSGRETVLRDYQWPAVGRGLRDAYLEVVNCQYGVSSSTGTFGLGPGAIPEREERHDGHDDTP